MNDFWANRLGVARPVPRQEPVSTGRAWWDESPQQPIPQVQQVSPEPPPQARSARYAHDCPECGADDYYAPPSTGPNGPARARCFTCGYPLSQTGSAGVRTHGGAPATPTRQIHDGSSQVNNTPFAHI